MSNQDLAIIEMSKYDALNKIAIDILGLETLETRNSDNLDFTEMSVWQIKSALEVAYTAGLESGR